MGMSTYIRGIKPPDEKWIKMKRVYDCCYEANIEIPDEVDDFFEGEPPNDLGVIVDITHEDFEGEMTEGIRVDLTKIDKDIKFIEFANSW